MRFLVISCTSACGGNPDIGMLKKGSQRFPRHIQVFKNNTMEAFAFPGLFPLPVHLLTPTGISAPSLLLRLLASHWPSRETFPGLLLPPWGRESTEGQAGCRAGGSRRARLAYLTGQSCSWHLVLCPEPSPRGSSSQQFWHGWRGRNQLTLHPSLAVSLREKVAMETDQEILFDVSALLFPKCCRLRCSPFKWGLFPPFLATTV